MKADATARVDARAVVAADVEIGAYSIVGADVEIGAGCVIGPHVVLVGPMRIGRNNRIFQFSSLGEAPQDLKYAGEPTRLEIGDENVIREFVTMNRGTPGGGGVTRVGSHNLFMAYTHVAHDCQVGDHTIFSNAASLAGHVEVGNHAILGGFTSVHQFCRIGAHSFSGLGTVINRDVPPYVSVAGNHARAYGINKNGLRRRGFSEASIKALHQCFRLLIKSKAARESVFTEAEKLAAVNEEARFFVEFVRASERGVVR